MGAAQSAPAQPPADPSHHFYPDGTRVRSLQSLTSVDTVFHNHASVPISIFWINYQGNETFYGIVEPGRHKRLHTFLTHPWTFRKTGMDASTPGNDLLVVSNKRISFPSRTQRDFYVTDPAVVPWSIETHKAHFMRAHPAFALEVKLLLGAHHRLMTRRRSSLGSATQYSSASSGGGSAAAAAPTDSLEAAAAAAAACAGMTMHDDEPVAATAKRQLRFCGGLGGSALADAADSPAAKSVSRVPATPSTVGGRGGGHSASAAAIFDAADAGRARRSSAKVRSASLRRSSSDDFVLVSPAAAAAAPAATAAPAPAPAAAATTAAGVTSQRGSCTSTFAARLFSPFRKLTAIAPEYGDTAAAARGSGGACLSHQLSFNGPVAASAAARRLSPAETGAALGTSLGDLPLDLVIDILAMIAPVHYDIRPVELTDMDGLPDPIPPPPAPPAVWVPPPPHPPPAGAAAALQGGDAAEVAAANNMWALAALLAAEAAAAAANDQQGDANDDDAIETSGDMDEEADEGDEGDEAEEFSGGDHDYDDYEDGEPGDDDDEGEQFEEGGYGAYSGQNDDDYGASQSQSQSAAATEGGDGVAAGEGGSQQLTNDNGN